MGDYLIIPLEQLPRYLDEETDGSQGQNRQSGTGRTTATTDHEAITIWLNRFQNSFYTQQNYRKEIERLYLWTINRGQALSDLTLEDLEEYKLFLKDPQPKDEWCGPSLARFETNWKPFNGPLGVASQNQALTILNTGFSFLTQMGYLKYNPLQLLFKRDLRQQINKNDKIDRYLEHDLWDFLWDFIQKQPYDSPRAHKEYERRLFLFSLLYLLAPRLSEVAHHRMNSFIEGRGKWWWQVTGKGNKVAKIPVPEDMLAALKRYRSFLSLSPLPFAADTTPLIMNLERTRGLTRKAIYLAVKKTVQDAANELAKHSPNKAEKLRRASTHWFRHTSITHQADTGVDIRHLKATARHASITTTQRYMHEEEDTWHEDINRHRRQKKSPKGGAA